MELADIEKLYLLLHARLQLLQALAEPAAHMSGAAPTAQQTVGLLVNAGMYDSAFNIASIFKLPLTGIFEGIASRSACCTRTSCCDKLTCMSTLSHDKLTCMSTLS